MIQNDDDDDEAFHTGSPRIGTTHARTWASLAAHEQAFAITGNSLPASPLRRVASHSAEEPSVRTFGGGSGAEEQRGSGLLAPAREGNVKGRREGEERGGSTPGPAARALARGGRAKAEPPQSAAEVVGTIPIPLVVEVGVRTGHGAKRAAERTPLARGGSAKGRKWADAPSSDDHDVRHPEDSLLTSKLVERSHPFTWPVEVKERPGAGVQGEEVAGLGITGRPALDGTSTEVTPRSAEAASEGGETRPLSSSLSCSALARARTPFLLLQQLLILALLRPFPLRFRIFASSLVFLLPHLQSRACPSQSAGRKRVRPAPPPASSPPLCSRNWSLAASTQARVGFAREAAHPNLGLDGWGRERERGSDGDSKPNTLKMGGCGRQRREKLKDEKAHGKETVRGRRSCSCGYRRTSHLGFASWESERERTGDADSEPKIARLAPPGVVYVHHQRLQVRSQPQFNQEDAGAHAAAGGGYDAGCGGSAVEADPVGYS
ncbi:hypothetical protein B0H11DRAFT_1906439 [Mycena galericulata]|nr:hypothetical protein B0H11DRAFT_1906439 [Mycena galericulata]